MKIALVVLGVLLSLPAKAAIYGEWETDSEKKTYLRITPRYFIFRDLGHFNIVESLYDFDHQNEYQVHLFTGRDDVSPLKRGDNRCKIHMSESTNDFFIDCNDGDFRRLYKRASGEE